MTATVRPIAEPVEAPRAPQPEADAAAAAPETGAPTTVIPAAAEQGPHHIEEPAAPEAPEAPAAANARRRGRAAAIIGGGVAALVAAGTIGYFIADRDGDEVAGTELIDEETCTRATDEDVFFSYWATGNRVAPPIQGETLQEKVDYYLNESLAKDRLQLVIAGIETGVITDVYGPEQITARVAEFGTNEEARNQTFSDVCNRLRSGTVREDTLTGSYATWMAVDGDVPTDIPQARQTRSSKTNAPVLVWSFDINGEEVDRTLLEECQQWAQEDDIPGIPFIPPPPELPPPTTTTTTTPETSTTTTPDTTTTTTIEETTETTFPPKPVDTDQPGDEHPRHEDPGTPDRPGTGPSGQPTNPDGTVNGEQKPQNPTSTSSTTTTTQPQTTATTSPQPSTTQAPQPANPSTPTTTPNTTPPPPASSI